MQNNIKRIILGEHHLDNQGISTNNLDEIVYSINAVKPVLLKMVLVIDYSCVCE